MQAGALCVEDAVSRKSVCRLCGNGFIDPGEVCDDAGAQDGCEDNCTAVRVGWSCTAQALDASNAQVKGSNGSAGVFETSVCVAGPNILTKSRGREETRGCCW
jgi:cysteine-rich repeat protein